MFTAISIFKVYIVTSQPKRMRNLKVIIYFVMKKPHPTIAIRMYMGVKLQSAQDIHITEYNTMNILMCMKMVLW